MKIIPLVAVLVCAVALGAITGAYAGDSGKQIILNNIQNTDSFGKWNNTDYTSFYNVRNLFDNLTNSWSFWSQYGQSGFSASFPPLKYPVCSVEIDVYSPKNTQFNFMLASNNETTAEVSSVLDNTKEIINVDNCLTNATSLQFLSNSPGNWTTLAEVRLFSNQTTNPGPVEPPVCPPGTSWNPTTQKCEPDVVQPGDNITKFNIINSTAIIDAKNSKILINITEGENSSILQDFNGKPIVPMTDDDKQEKEEKEEEEKEREEQQEEKEQEEEEEEEDDKN